MKKSLLILLVDDNESMLILMRKASEKAHLDCEIHWVRDGEEALEYLLHRGGYQDPQRSPEPDIVVLDLNMPRKDGREALREIKTYPHLQHIPVVVLSHSDMEKDVAAVTALGVDAYIKKPSGFQEFTQVLEKIAGAAERKSSAQ